MDITFRSGVTGGIICSCASIVHTVEGKMNLCRILCGKIWKGRDSVRRQSGKFNLSQKRADESANRGWSCSCRLQRNRNNLWSTVELKIAS